MHLVGLLLAFVFIVIASAFMKRDPSKWYGDMLCMGCGYRWVSRKNQPPARCPKCSGQYIHAVTGNEPVPPEIVAPPPRAFVRAEPTMPQYRERHQQLEHVLANANVSPEQKALAVVALTQNADAVNLMHRLKIGEPEAESLLRHLEAAGHVSAPDEMGERTVIANVRVAPSISE